MKIAHIRLFLLSAIAFNGYVLQAQNTQQENQLDDLKKETINAGWGNLNYSVPEAPAFKILGSNPSSILKPTSTKEIAVSLGNYYLSNGPIIPKNLAVSISPALLTNNLNLKEYQKNAFWYRASLSLGTNFNDNGTYDFGVGLRFTISDKTDIRTDQKAYQDFLKITKINLDIKDTIRQQIRNEEPPGTLLSEVEDALDDTNNPKHSRIQKRFDELFKEKIDSLKKEANNIRKGIDNDFSSHVEEVNALRKNFIEQNWNKQIIQVGIAGLFPSKDSLANNLSSLAKAGLWFSAGFPSGKNGQWLLGARVLGIQKDSSKTIKQWDESIATRYYYGKNTTKVYLEAEGLLKNSDFNKFTYSMNVGGELNLFSSLWIDFAFGLSKQGGEKAMFVPSINLKFGSPEKK